MRLQTVKHLCCLAALCGSWAAPVLCAASSADTPRVIELIAGKDDRFKLPNQKKQVLELKAGEPIILRVTAQAGDEHARDGAVHGLVVKPLRDQGWDVRLKEGTQDLKLTAPAKPGEYTIECTVKCGSGHEDMRLKMVVKP